ncbi:hypothetical protein Tco_0762897 [Tanacetum coccineum]
MLQIILRYFLFGRHLEDLHVTWAHLEKKRARLQTNTKTLEDLCSQSLETVSQAIHDAVTTHKVTASQHFETASARIDSHADLEDSTYDGILVMLLLLMDVHVRYTQIDINYAAGGNLRALSAEEAWETIEDCAQCDKHWKNPTSTIHDQTIANLKTQLVENEVVRVMIPKCMTWLDDEPIRDLNTIEDKVDNPSPQSTLQVLPSFEVYTPPMTHLEDIEETIGILMEVEPLDHIKLEDLSLGTSTRDPFLSSKGFPSIDESKPQLLPNLSPLDVNIGYKRGTDPSINPDTPDGFRMKVVKPLTIHTPPSPHVAYLHQNGAYCYYHPHLTSSVGETHLICVK